MNTHFANRRSGAVAVLLCTLIMPLLMLLALSVDYGFLCYVKTDLQRAADQAAIAAVRDLVPDDLGNQNLIAVKSTVRQYVANNLGSDFSVTDSDIEIGRYDPDTIYTNLTILDSGIYDTVRLTLRRDDLANRSVALFFARLFNRDKANLEVTATAVLQKARYLGPGTSVLPIAVEEIAWNQLPLGDEMSVYGDGRIEDGGGNPIPGNWGTLDIGSESNSTSDLRDQMVNGLRQEDLDSLHQQGRIDTPEYIDSQQEIDLNADTGFSAGMKHAMWEIEGSTRVMPIYRTVQGNGNNASYEIVSWASIRIIDSRFQGSKNSFVQVRKSFNYDAALLPNPDLSDPSGSIENTFTSPALVQ